jgi:hypothetical protein
MRNRRGFGLILDKEARSAPAPERKAALETGTFRVDRRSGGGTSEPAGSEVPFEGRDSSQEGGALGAPSQLEGYLMAVSSSLRPEGTVRPKVKQSGCHFRADRSETVANKGLARAERNPVRGSRFGVVGAPNPGPIAERGEIPRRAEGTRPVRGPPVGCRQRWRRETPSPAGRSKSGPSDDDRPVPFVRVPRARSSPVRCSVRRRNPRCARQRPAANPP